MGQAEKPKPTKTNDDEAMLVQSNSQWGSRSSAIDEIREDVNLDYVQDFGDEHYWNLESDQVLDAESVSDDYLDFLLGFE